MFLFGSLLLKSEGQWMTSAPGHWSQPGFLSESGHAYSNTCCIRQERSFLHDFYILNILSRDHFHSPFKSPIRPISSWLHAQFQQVKGKEAVFWKKTSMCSPVSNPMSLPPLLLTSVSPMTSFCSLHPTHDCLPVPPTPVPSCLKAFAHAGPSPLNVLSQAQLRQTEHFCDDENVLYLCSSIW